MEVEFNSAFKRENDTIDIDDSVLMFTPPIDENYWIFRVKLFKDQSILAFPKFFTIGIGFAIEEEDWNRNLPYWNSYAEEIYNHIKINKKYDEISDKDCIDAINLLIKKCEEYSGIKQDISKCEKN